MSDIQDMVYPLLKSEFEEAAKEHYIIFVEKHFITEWCGDKHYGALSESYTGEGLEEYVKTYHHIDGEYFVLPDDHLAAFLGPSEGVFDE